MSHTQKVNIIGRTQAEEIALGMAHQAKGSLWPVELFSDYIFRPEELQEYSDARETVRAFQEKIRIT